ncbi:MAG: hypothetical protein HC772_17305 [Leptolyngbyaceae cyanobacterium CRU_2_3]|nr:hypothetical protein [Leptolyngbyaceae cyanobacterium CRU_2_3]
MKASVKRWLKDIPYFKQVFNERNQLRLEVDRLQETLTQLSLENAQLLTDQQKLKDERNRLKANQFYEPGHFYSAVPDIAEIKLRESEIFDQIPDVIPGIDLNEAEQIALLEELVKYYPDLPFAASKKRDCAFTMRTIFTLTRMPFFSFP